MSYRPPDADGIAETSHAVGSDALGNSWGMTVSRRDLRLRQLVVVGLGVAVGATVGATVGAADDGVGVGLVR